MSLNNIVCCNNVAVVDLAVVVSLYLSVFDRTTMFAIVITWFLGTCYFIMAGQDVLYIM